ncbi:MAG TPA: methylenetetrahydrofolate reductase C-terminal domain-containing protein [Atribacteraceae bacterium]|nr:methylenetetrahydrofolate reductase C-terminal domain-containing protein [Atribacteraceae bacterium]
MIVGERKPITEIIEEVGDAETVLVLGCGTCVTVCLSGGEREARELASLLRLKGKYARDITVERQCEHEFVRPLSEEIEKVDAVISLACGVGTQLISETFPHRAVYPGLNTTFMGLPVEQGRWEEHCLGCGNCLVHHFAGCCPVTRCAKSLLNGPCGGSKDGKCEVKTDRSCAWQIIYDRLKLQNRITDLVRLYPPKDWSSSRYGGHRTMVREDMHR